MDGKSQSITEEQKQKLRELFPEVFTEDKVDWNELKATLGQEVGLGERYGLSWKGKSNVFRAIQEQTTKTLKPVPEESVDWDTTKNLFIEGDNLEVLKTLHKAYYGKIKMIYIDPPYNTGNDFVYNDKFAQTQAEYEQESGQRDEEGNIKRTDGLRKNSKDGGHFHSNWLNMMYPRLYLARNLLRQDGVIFVSIDDNEVHNLRPIMNEIFGEENFVAQVIWEKKFAPQNDAKWFSDNHDYVLVYAKNKENWHPRLLPRNEEADARYKNPDNDPRGPWASSDLTVKTYAAAYDYPITTPSGKVINPPRGRCWRTSKENMQKLIKDNQVWFGPSGDNVPRLKRFLSDVQQGIVPLTIWKQTEVSHNQEARQEVKRLFDDFAPFDTPKPTKLIRKMLYLSTSGDDIVLDFFSGSATTADAVMRLNAEDGGRRVHVQVQLPELTDVDSEAYKAGYKTIADIAKERIRRAGKKVMEDFRTELAERKDALDFGFRVYKLTASNFKAWTAEISDAESVRQQLFTSIDPIVEGATEKYLLTELLIKNGIELTKPVEQRNGYYFVPSQGLAISLADEFTHGLFTEILAVGPKKIILLDSALKNNDQLKANLLLQAEQKDIEIKVL